MTKIRIKDEHWTDVTRESDPDEQWDHDDTATSHSIKSFYVSGEDDYHDLTVMFDIKENQEYYLLYAIYSTGDSFSHHEGEISFVDLFESEEMAEENRRLIVEHDGKSYNIMLQLEDGRIYKTSVPWAGYFEHLTEVIVQCINVSKKDE